MLTRLLGDPSTQNPFTLREEIATMMGLRRGAVLTRLHRARRKLAERITAELEAHDD